MPTIEEAYTEGSHKAASASECLNRCLSAPFPSSLRTERISALRKTQIELQTKLSKAYAELTAPSAGEVQAANNELTALRERLEHYSRELEALQSEQGLIELKIQKLRSQRPTSPEAKAELDALQDELTGLKLRHKETTEHYRRAKGEKQREIIARRDEAQQTLTKRQEAQKQEPAPPELLAVVQQISQLLDETGAFEKEVRAGAGEVISKSIRAGLEAQATAFREAEAVHITWATRMLVMIALLIVLSGTAIWLLFIRANTINAQLDPSQTNNVVDTVQHVVLVGVGRLALLAFLAWALKHAADLHKIHSEQSVIYRDRLAALGIAESILAATPDLEQKSATLKTLADGYLNFEQNAFRSRRMAPAASTLRAEIRQLKGLAEAIRPVLDGAGNIADKLVKKP